MVRFEVGKLYQNSWSLRVYKCLSLILDTIHGRYVVMRLEPSEGYSARPCNYMISEFEKELGREDVWGTWSEYDPPPLPRFRKHQKVRFVKTQGFWDKYYLEKTGHVDEITEWRAQYRDSFRTYPAGYYYAIDSLGAWIWEGCFENADMRVFTE